MKPGELTLNLGGQLMDLSTPRVMGIVNATPDSFYSASRVMTSSEVRARVADMVAQGVDLLDVGACSTRPGADEVSTDEEMERLARALDVVREVAPEVPVSVDTYRAEVARRCVEQWGVEIINDIAGGTLDPDMFAAVAELRVAYVLMHMRGTPATMQTLTDYGDVTAEVVEDLARKLYELRGLGVCDVIIDPGFGFAKTVAQNLELLDRLGEFVRIGAPVLVGLSRKSVIWQTLGCTPAESLPGTVALQTIALDRGANILRVHDVAETVQSVKLVKAMRDTRPVLSSAPII